jgi:hypothetical protein
MSGSTPGHHRGRSKLEVRSGAGGVRASAGSSRGKQAFFDSVETFPGGFGQRRVCSHNIADHLPGGQIERAFGRGAHRQRNGTLRAEANPLRGRFLARLHAHGLREQVHCHRFLSGFEFPTTAKAIQVIQRSVSGWPAMVFDLRCSIFDLDDTVSNAMPLAQVCRRIPANGYVPPERPNQALL